MYFYSARIIFNSVYIQSLISRRKVSIVCLFCVDEESLFFTRMILGFSNLLYILCKLIDSLYRINKSNLRLYRLIAETPIG